MALLAEQAGVPAEPVPDARLVKNSAGEQTVVPVLMRRFEPRSAVRRDLEAIPVHARKGDLSPATMRDLVPVWTLTYPWVLAAVCPLDPLGRSVMAYQRRSIIKRDVYDIPSLRAFGDDVARLFIGELLSLSMPSRTAGQYG